jgi:kynureninase
MPTESSADEGVKIYWSLKQVPQLAGLTWRERNIALKKFSGRYILRARPSWLGLAAYLAVPLLPIVGILAARAMWGDSASVNLAEALAACVGFFVGVFLNFQIAANRLARFLREHRSQESEIVL